MNDILCDTKDLSFIFHICGLAQCMSASGGPPRLSAVTSLIKKYRQSGMDCLVAFILISCVLRGLVGIPMYFLISCFIKIAMRCTSLDCSVLSLTLTFPSAGDLNTDHALRIFCI